MDPSSRTQEQPPSVFILRGLFEANKSGMNLHKFWK